MLSDELGATSCYDVIVSNPPYITEAEKQNMEANVLDWAPGLALFVPDDDPLRFYRRTVSYTHLDVYKRQAFCVLRRVRRLELKKIIINVLLRPNSCLLYTSRCV